MKSYYSVIQGFREKIPKLNIPRIGEKEFSAPRFNENAPSKLIAKEVISPNDLKIALTCGDHDSLALGLKIKSFNDGIKDNPHYIRLSHQIKLVGGLLKWRNRTNDGSLTDEINQTLSLLGHSSPVKGKGIKILSLDGGGTRGLMSLHILRILEEEFGGKNLINEFDLVFGTSTGAIVAFLTCIAKFSVEEAIEQYRKIAVEIFTQTRLDGTGTFIRERSWYNTKKFEEHLRSYKLSKEPLYVASKLQSPKVCAVSCLLDSNVISPYIFRSYNHHPLRPSRNQGDCYTPCWQVLRATTAAPLYFADISLNGQRHQDGGVLVNNPTALAIHEARQIWPDTPLQTVLSIGTGLIQSQTGSVDDGFTSSFKKTVFNFMDSATNTESVHTTLKDLLPHTTYFRFNPQIKEPFPLDECRPNKLNLLVFEAHRYSQRHYKRVSKTVQSLMQKKRFYQRFQDWAEYWAARLI